MTDNLFFGADDTENRFVSETKQRNFIKSVMVAFPMALVVINYDAITGFKIAVELPEELKADYYPWLFSTSWYGCSNTLNEMYTTQGQSHLVKMYLALSQKRYPECFTEERLKTIPNYQ